MYTVYVLRSKKVGKFYIGFTSDLEARMLSHNFLGKGWTKRYRPWQVIYEKSFESKSEAMQYEKWLKAGVGRDFIAKLFF